MSRVTWSALWLTPALLGATALAASASIPQSDHSAALGASDTASTLQQITNYSTGETAASPDGSIEQVTSVSQLSDVKPTDWAFQALQSLVERYGCIVGYPDKKYRGNQATTRYEFAAGLNACMDRINELIAAGTADLVKKEDLLVVQKLQEEFAAELATLRGQVDALEVRTATLERQQFSTTTKLNAEVIFAVSDAFGTDKAINSDQQRTRNVTGVRPAINGGATIPQNAIFSDRVRLNLDTSFTGKDRLRTRLQARNTQNFSGSTATNTNMARLGFDGDNGNAVELSRLEYRFAIGALTQVFIGTGNNDGLEYNDSINTLSPTESSANGSISRFGRFNPIYRLGTGTGIIINQKFGHEYTLGNKFTLSLGYLVPTTTASSPASKNGLFDGSYAALAQLVFQPNPQFGLGFTYVRGYYNNGIGTSGSTGSGFANNPFNSPSPGVLGSATNVPTSADAFGLEVSYRLSPKVVLSGWGGYTRAEAERTLGTGTVVRKGDSADIWNWAVTLAFPDLFKEGNLGGIIFGMPPKVTGSDYGLAVPTATSARREDTGTSYHLEAFYRFRVNDNIAVTPGFFVLFNPEHNDANDTIFVGTLRTTFTF
jgi:hypothetical protein